MITGLTVAVVAASKWLIAAKIMGAVGTGVLTAAPAVEAMKEKRRAKKGYRR